MNFNKEKHVVLSLSGGLDSSTLLLRCLKEYDSVTAISFDYGQKHRVELDRAQSLVDYINNGVVDNRGANPYPNIKYKQIKLDGLAELLNSTLVTGGEDVPEGHYKGDNMKATVVPNRNKIFSSITQAIALSVVGKTGGTCDIALGIHAGDHDIYPDCRQDFRDADVKAFRVGNWDSEKVGFYTPYLEGDKFTILQDGEVLCKELGLDFDEVYKRTMTSYKPICIPEKPSNLLDELVWRNNHEWFSDHKSASSVERIEAFIKLGRKDPAPYADESGEVDWEYVEAETRKTINDFHAKQN